MLACAGAPAPRIAPPPPLAQAPQGGPTPQLSAAALPAAPNASLAASIDAIFSAFTRPGTPSPGCAVGVYRAGEVVFSKGYGYADLEHADPITDATPFYTASLSKQFTAAAVMLLVGDGKLSLDDDVHKYIPELRDFGARITLDHLLHHTSGLRDYHLLLQLEGLNEEDVITSREVLWLLAHQRTLNFPSGAHILYSSSGYVLLAEIVARVSGESFGAFLARRLLQPLGMTSSLIRDDHARLIPHKAIGYSLYLDGQPRVLVGNLEYAGSSNFVTTIRDLARWDANFYDPKVGGPSFVDGMRTRGKLTDGTELEYAMGLSEYESHGLHVESHDGSYAGYRSVMTRYPSERLSVAVLCNTTEADADALGEKVAAVFLPQLSAREPAVTAPAPAPAPATVRADFGHDLASLAGLYVDTSTAETRTIEVADGVVRARLGRSATAAFRELVPVGPGDLVVKGGRTHYAYQPAQGKQPARLVRTAKTELARTFVRVDPVDRVDNLAEYAGRYGSDELAHDIEIRIEDGHLIMAALGGATLGTAFTPLSRDLFVSQDAGWKSTDDVGWRFERDGRGRVVRLVASTDRTRGVALKRRD
jgi:CubicO group peptidase (beta-lactamase class C family)